MEKGENFFYEFRSFIGDAFHRRSTVWIEGQHETRLDLSKFVHGTNWATVHDQSLFQ
jgi:hypothetical protein